jgi:hypothetical protein
LYFLQLLIHYSACFHNAVKFAAKLSLIPVIYASDCDLSEKKKERAVVERAKRASRGKNQAIRAPIRVDKEEEEPKPTPNEATRRAFEAVFEAEAERFLGYRWAGILEDLKNPDGTARLIPGTLLLYQLPNSFCFRPE